MKAISIRQPFASAILAGVKRHENRNWLPDPSWASWDPDLDGPLPARQHLWLALHAGRNLFDFPRVHGRRGRKRVQALLAEQEAMRQLWPQMPPWEDLPKGAILGVVQVVGAVLGTDPWISDNPWVVASEDNWAWIIDQHYALDKPIPYPGRQGLFEVEDSITEELRRLVRTRRRTTTSTGEDR